MSVRPYQTPRPRRAFIWDEDISPVVPDSQELFVSSPHIPADTQISHTSATSRSDSRVETQDPSTERARSTAEVEPSSSEDIGRGSRESYIVTSSSQPTVSEEILSTIEQQLGQPEEATQEDTLFEQTHLRAKTKTASSERSEDSYQVPSSRQSAISAEASSSGGQQLEQPKDAVHKDTLFEQTHSISETKTSSELSGDISRVSSSSQLAVSVEPLLTGSQYLNSSEEVFKSQSQSRTPEEVYEGLVRSTPPNQSDIPETSHLNSSSESPPPSEKLLSVAEGFSQDTQSSEVHSEIQPSSENLLEGSDIILQDAQSQSCAVNSEVLVSSENHLDASEKISQDSQIVDAGVPPLLEKLLNQEKLSQGVPAQNSGIGAEDLQFQTQIPLSLAEEGLDNSSISNSVDHSNR